MNFCNCFCILSTLWPPTFSIIFEVLMFLSESFKPFKDPYKIDLYFHKQFQGFVCFCICEPEQNLIFAYYSMKTKKNSTYAQDCYTWIETDLFHHCLVVIR